MILTLGSSSTLNATFNNNLDLPSQQVSPSDPLINQLHRVTQSMTNTILSFTNSCSLNSENLEYKYCPFLGEEIEKILQRTNEDIREIMEQLLILSFSDVNNPLHRRLLIAIGPMAYIEDLNLVDKALPAWRFFFKLLKHYAPGTPNYEGLDDFHKKFICTLHEFHNPSLMTEKHHDEL